MFLNKILSHNRDLLKNLEQQLNQLPKNSSVAVGLSGGVDSSVTAKILLEMGVKVFGVFMRNWVEQDEDGKCSADLDYQDVVKISEKMGLPYYTIDLSREYQEKVFTTFLNEIKLGRTPNPDILCNKEIKFHYFWENVKKMGASALATGHYAKVFFDHSFDDSRLDWCLAKSLDQSKDQTYFLGQISRELLPRTLFPLGDLLKSEVRLLANFWGLSNAKKKDSTGICFIGERDFLPFIQKYIRESKGFFKDLSGKILGEHQGSCFYTVGQRKGLGVGGPEGPWFVAYKHLLTNTIYLSNQLNHPSMLSDRFALRNVNILKESFGRDILQLKISLNCVVKTRYRQLDQACQVFIGENGQLSVYLNKPIVGVVEGQYAVFYNNQGHCLGSAEIDTIRRPYWENFAFS